MPLRSSSSRPVAILVCYHFHPSREVAVRRVGAFADTLKTAGLDVWVVSCFGGSAINSGAKISSNITAIRVIEPPKVITRWLVALKRASYRQRRTNPTATAASSIPELDNVQTGWLGALRILVLETLMIIDSHKHWATRAARTAISSAAGANVKVVIASGPPHSGLAAGCYIARRLRVPFVADFRDPLGAGSEGIRHDGRLGHFARRTLERLLVAHATAITTTTPGIGMALRARHPGASDRVHTVLNGFDGVLIHHDSNTDHRLNILFAGILYVNRDPFPFLEALETLLSSPDVHANRITVRFIGECTSFRGRSLAEWLSGKRAAGVVTLLPEISAEELVPYVQEATVLLNLAQGQKQMIPAKTFEHLASGKEILAICEPDSETGMLLADVAGPICVTPGDQHSLEAALTDLYNRHVVQGTLHLIDPKDVQRFSRSRQNEVFREVVLQTITPRHD